MILIHLPSIVDDGRVDTYLQAMHLAKIQKKVRVDWSKNKFISPAGHAILACMFDTFVEQHAQVSHIYTKDITKAAYPSVQKFLKISSTSGKLPLPKEQNYHDSKVLVRGNEDAIDIHFLENLEQLFGNYLGEDLLFTCRLILNELMQNAADHSSAERYYLYAGLWEKEFHCGCLDMGVSIPAKLSQVYAEESDLDFLSLALKKGSTTRRQRKGGFGLYYFFEKIKSHGGKLTLVSRGAQYRKYFSSRRAQKNPIKYPLAGTWCFARFPINKSGR